MEKPGQGSSNPLIIDRPDLITLRRKWIESSVTVVLWLLWLYFIAPIVTLLFWLFGLKHFYRELFPGGGLESLVYLLKSGGIIMAIIFFIDIVWVNYNYHWVFKMLRVKREYVPQATMQDFAKMLHADPEVVEHMKREHRIDVTIENNHLVIAKSE